MPLKPTEQQRKIIEDKTGLFTVRACPGSGKTFTVAARLNHILGKWKDRNRGIAVASFTNVAWKEIAGYLASEFGRPLLSPPHFLGTLDSFINKYVFLPFGHLVMPTNARPILMGPPHDDEDPIGRWIWWPNSDCYRKGCQLNEFTYDANRNVIRIGYPNMGYKCSVAGQPCTKKKPFLTQKGFATQTDANFFSLLVLKTHPNIAKALAYRFPVLIVDEAQDTSAQQMGIIDLLIENGLSEVMLVGDPDQAIYEWREAEPSLFLEKCKNWKDSSESLEENWRSSSNICQATSRMSSDGRTMKAVNPKVAAFAAQPRIFPYSSDKEIAKIAESFVRTCSEAGVAIGDRHALARGKELANVVVPGTLSEKLDPWSDGAPLTEKLARARYLLDSKEYPRAVRLMERIVFKEQHAAGSPSFARMYPSSSHLFVRGQIFAALVRLPATEEKTIGNWVEEARIVVCELQFLGKDRELKLKKASAAHNYADLRFRTLFGKPAELCNDQELSAQTVHAAKGKSLDAVLVVLKAQGARPPAYAKLLAKRASLLDCEELRIVYVAMTRARRILWLLVPETDQAAWNEYLGLS